MKIRSRTALRVLAIDGTATLPGIAFTSQPALGFRRSAASVIELPVGRLDINPGLTNVRSLTFFSEVYGIGMSSTDLVLWGNTSQGVSIKDSTNSGYDGNTIARFAGANGASFLGTATIGFKQIFFDYTNTGTVGAVTINKAAGRVNIAAGGTSVVVTNSLATVASHILAVMSTADVTGRVISVIPAAGSFTINTVAVTAQTSFDFFIINAD